MLRIISLTFSLVIGGDFNTMCNGIARLNPILAADWHSCLGTLGMSDHCALFFFCLKACP